KPVGDRQRVGDWSRDDSVALLLQCEVDVRVAAAIHGRLTRCAGLSLRGVGSSAVRDDLELVVGGQRRVKGLEELAGDEPIVGNDAQALGLRPRSRRPEVIRLSITALGSVAGTGDR